LSRRHADRRPEVPEVATAPHRAASPRPSTARARSPRVPPPAARVVGALALLPLLLLGALAGAGVPAFAQEAGDPGAVAGTVPTPESVIGWEPGADRKLVDYDQVLEYFRALDEASDRVRLEEIGTTARGRPMILAFVSSAENLESLEEYRRISERLAADTTLSDAEARRLAERGRAVLWLDGGLHSTEVAGHQFPPVLAHRMATEESEEMRRIRDRVIVMLMPSLNPDGQDVVVDWYRRVVGTPFETAPLPELYHEYVGHDNNRDWFMLTQRESRAVAHQLWHRWYPQIVVNHHQTSPFPGRIFIPPFADPVNPNIPSMVVTGINLVGTAMHQRFLEEGKPGAVSRVSFTQWWNGGMRTAPYFHNQVGILTEVALHEYATPRFYEPDSLPDRFFNGLPADRASTWYPEPWEGGWWRLSDAVDYMVTASMGAAEVASRRKEKWLYNMHLMARRAVEAGRAGAPFAYVFPTEQRDPVETVELLAVLRRGGIRLHRATEPFTAGGERYGPGAVVAYAAQPFRAHLLDMMEPQQYPTRTTDDGRPITPYDLAGWTLPIQMGVEAVRVDEPFEAPTEELTATEFPPPEGGVEGEPGARLHLLSSASNGAYRAINALLAEGVRVERARASFEAGGRSWPAGTWVVRRGGGERLADLAARHGVDFTGTAPELRLPERFRVRAPRIGLYRSWVPSMDEGWTRWILERYGFSYRTLRDGDVREGDLSGLDVIVLPDQSARAILKGHLPGTMPPEFTGGMGAEGAAALKRWVRRGGTLVALDDAKDFVVEQFGLPLRDPVAGLPSREFFIPGSLVRLRVDPDDPLGYGMPGEAAASFVRSGALEIVPPASEGERSADRTVEVVARYGSRDLLLSGWETGAREHLADVPALARLPLGEGHVVLFAFRPQFRAQPRATFKLLFNALYAGTMEDLPYEEGDG